MRSGFSTNTRSTNTATIIRTATTDSTTPKKASAFHPRSAQVNAHQDSHPDGEGLLNVCHGCNLTALLAVPP